MKLIFRNFKSITKKPKKKAKLKSVKSLTTNGAGSKRKKTKGSKTPKTDLELNIPNNIRKILTKKNSIYTYDTQQHKNNLTIAEYYIFNNDEIESHLIDLAELEYAGFSQSSKGFNVKFSNSTGDALSITCTMKVNARRHYLITATISDNNISILNETIDCPRTVYLPDNDDIDDVSI